MSGHSKWSKIKHKKGIEDQKRGAVFSRLSKQIIASIREGGGSDSGANMKLRAVIKKAREANMPNSNIERAIKSFEQKASSVEELLLEGYAGGGVGVVVEALTDNRNRSISELKFIFKSNGGTLAESGSVLYQFERLGRVVVKGLTEEKALAFLDHGVMDMRLTGPLKKKLELWVRPEKMEVLVVELAKNDQIEVLSEELAFKAKNPIGEYLDPKFKEVRALLEELLDHEDVVGLYYNLRK
jgi:YebC/PmpR family DNA-binding regulatory protein